MSADNILLCIKSPRRDDKGFEWHVMDASFSSFCYEDDWKTGELCDTLIMQLRTIGWDIVRFDTEEKADAFCDCYVAENIVEYGCSNATLQFPWPTEEEFKATEARWEADRPRRELTMEILALKNRLDSLRTIEIPCALIRLEADQKMKEDPDWADIIDDLIATENERLVTLRELYRKLYIQWSHLVRTLYKLALKIPVDHMAVLHDCFL
ncbi:MAG: hypothetical protein UU08_C0004G0022 [Candidatus Uhrbacteria bacterium GW2011_GWE2_40_58]|nr:MAG: hypothetical protein UT94_C0009G0022 [Candidatus Uhrbacteria bacterium GW2011_GWF2_40_263]KKR68035.1 MAG: hypothetical protein UU08_C0004G0022 [Candidatus Uhrbacteria bacterium GW2011_GWE2_40_58]OGL92930.1 MAG: hypothetical protein A2239_04230 [Candidatus Uhrbacteria bacterium RIFOXYA2_FULL_40_9]OGL97068.1 MAG: hypothetical protein A2332_04235 [Candidatus Uhrbacteria bacterium RIFOXYB2_FULL_41_18]